MSKRRPDRRASDGLPARDTGDWAEDKLSFLDQYLPVALQATQRKLERHYVDLFAGPGLNIDRNRGGEFDAAALRALRLTAPAGARASFTHAHLVNLDPAHHAALRERVERLIARGESHVPVSRIEHIQGDANEALTRVLARIHPRAYSFLFADIERLEHWPWTTVQSIRDGAHESIDFCMLLPMDMAINRLISYEKEHTDSHAGALTRFFGTDRWNAIADQRITGAQSPELRRQLEALYAEQLSALWKYVRTVRDVKLRGEQRLYKLLLATDSDAGSRIAGWETRTRPSSGQIGFDL